MTVCEEIPEYLVLSPKDCRNLVAVWVLILCAAFALGLILGWLLF